MCEFDRKWKVRTGCVTLAITSLLTLGWCRSPFVEDSIEIATGKHTSVALVSAYSQLVFKTEFCQSHDYTSYKPTWRSIKLYPGMRWYDASPTVFNWKWLGFGHAEVPYKELFDDDWDDFRSTYEFAPYWSVILPLTLLSAWLLWPNRGNKR